MQGAFQEMHPGLSSGAFDGIIGVEVGDFCCATSGRIQ